MAFPPARRPPSLPRKSLVTGPRHSGTCRARLCTRLVHSAGPSWCRWPWERRSRGPRAAPAGNWGSPASGWWRGSSRRPRAPTSRVRGGRGRGGRGAIGERCRAASPDLLSYFSQKLLGTLSTFLSYILAGYSLASLLATQDRGQSTTHFTQDMG